MSAEFKPGDRVKVEYEAEYREDGVSKRVAVLLHEGRHFAAPLSALSKLPDPEPQWRKGDVVRFREWPDGVWHVALRTGSRWECECGQAFVDEVTRRVWRVGRVEVLHREDQP